MITLLCMFWVNVVGKIVCIDSSHLIFGHSFGFCFSYSMCGKLGCVSKGVFKILWILIGLWTLSSVGYWMLQSGDCFMNIQTWRQFNRVARVILKIKWIYSLSFRDNKYTLHHVDICKQQIPKQISQTLYCSACFDKKKKKRFNVSDHTFAIYFWVLVNCYTFEFKGHKV